MTDTRVNTAEKPKLSVIPRGVWRNHWRQSQELAHIPTDNEHEALITRLPDGSWYGAGFWDTREDAEARAKIDLEWNASEVDRCGLSGALYDYLGPVFFPDP